MGRSLCRNIASPNSPSLSPLMAVQMILPDGSISGNLVCTIPEVITTLRGKPKLQETLKMTMEQMELINEEIMVSNARKFGKSSIARAHF